MAETLRIAGAARGPAVRFTFDGVALEGGGLKRTSTR